MIEKEYRGEKIYFVEAHDLWRVEFEDETEFESESLSAVKKFIDQKAKKTFKRIPIWVHYTRWGRWVDDDEKATAFVKAEITSVTPSGDIWMVRAGDKKAEKLREVAWVQSPANDKIVAEIEAIKKEIDEKKDRGEKLEGKLASFDTKKLKEDNNVKEKSYY